MKHKYSSSKPLREDLRTLYYKEQYKVCKKFYQLLTKGFHGDDSMMCERFRESFEMIDPSLPEESFLPLHWALNDLDNAIYEIDLYDPMTFFEIAEKLAPVIEKGKKG